MGHILETIMLIFINSIAEREREREIVRACERMYVCMCVRLARNMNAIGKRSYEIV
jgi:uncharacterized protein (DUF488 family)